jgi:hypothetical protein
MSTTSSRRRSAVVLTALAPVGLSALLLAPAAAADGHDNGNDVYPPTPPGPTATTVTPSPSTSPPTEVGGVKVTRPPTEVLGVKVSLPVTGTEALSYGAGAAVLIGSGTALVVASRRRRAGEHES